MFHHLILDDARIIVFVQNDCTVIFIDIFQASHSLEGRSKKSENRFGATMDSCSVESLVKFN